MITDFSQLAALSGRNASRLRVAVACGYDDSTLSAVNRAVEEGLAEAVFVGARARTEAAGLLSCGPEHVSFVEAATDAEAAARAVELVRTGRADALMKGLVGSDCVLRAVLDKQAGLLPPGNVLCHLAAAEIPAYGKLLFFTDAAVIPYPTQAQREAQVAQAAQTCRLFGIAVPRVALVHCSEKASDKFPHTAGYALIRQRAERGDWGPIVVDGPLDVRTSCDAEACRVKGISSPLEGQADVLVFPDIEAGNTFYKTITRFAGARCAATLAGASRPVVLPSRGDDAETKYLSLCMAALQAGTHEQAERQDL